MPNYYGFLVLVLSLFFLFKEINIYRDKNLVDLNSKNVFDKIEKTNKNIMPLLGIVLFSCTIFYNFLYDTTENWFGNLDIISYLNCILLISFYKIPNYYKYERNFSFYFLTLLLFILALPIFFGLTEIGDNDDLIEFILVRPLSFSLSLFGFETFPVGKTLYYYLE